MKVGIACDHRGYKLKEKLKKYLLKKGYDVLDLGTNSTDSVDYSDYGIALGEKVRDKEVEFGIAICGTGIGISIACNKVKGIRCARVTNSRDAKETRIHNNANIVALNEKLFLFEAKDIVDAFLNTKYVPDERFERRINKMLDYEGK
jgi:ribose 5-phosphate isomerase B